MRTVGWGGFGMLLGGGIAYTVGAVIYALKKPNLAFLKSFGFHEIFHVFVMVGSAFHIAFMFVYVLKLMLEMLLLVVLMLLVFMR